MTLTIKKRSPLAAGIAAASIVFLAGTTGCGSDDSGDTTSSTANTASSGTQEAVSTEDQGPQPTSAAGGAEGQAGGGPVLSDTLQGVVADLPDGISYAPVDITADGQPELLVKLGDKEVSTVEVYTSDGKKASGSLYDGAASAGGERALVEGTADGRGILQKHWMAGTGATDTVRWELSGTDLVQTSDTWSYRVDQTPSDLSALETQIQWYNAAGEPVDNWNAAVEAAAGGNASSEAGGAASGARADYPAYAKNSATSSAFAQAIYEAVISTIDAGGYPTSLSVYSPSTQQTYAVKCNSMSGTLVCSGGNGAAVNIIPAGFDPNTYGGMEIIWG